DYRQHPFIFHARNRSEIEYGLRCQMSWPGRPTRLYANRSGYRNDSGEPRCHDVMTHAAEVADVDRYRASYEEFIDRCGVREMIASSSARITLGRVKDSLAAIDDKTLVEEEAVWRKSFAGTRFLKDLADRFEQLKTASAGEIT
ncbi:MAG: hypothetical protein HRU11_11635, partial [Parvularculaceae bacterium]|nr:hypothetical protein [Parvularculaceae bacterium]